MVRSLSIRVALGLILAIATMTVRLARRLPPAAPAATVGTALKRYVPRRDIMAIPLHLH